VRAQPINDASPTSIEEDAIMVHLLDQPDAAPSVELGEAFPEGPFAQVVVLRERKDLSRIDPDIPRHTAATRATTAALELEPIRIPNLTVHLHRTLGDTSIPDKRPFRPAFPAAHSGPIRYAPESRYWALGISGPFLARDRYAATKTDGKKMQSRNPLTQLYRLLSSTSFAITILLTLAIASILGILIIEQIPIRGEMAQLQYADRQHEPWIWVLTHMIPPKPFRSVPFQTLLGLLSLSLLACTIKRWRHNWRLAFSIPASPAGILASEEVLTWRTRSSGIPEAVSRFLRQRFFRARRREEGGSITFSATRGGISRLGPVLTHLGFLLLVIGGIVMGLTGSSEMAWMRPGDRLEIPATGVELRLDGFRIERAPNGRVSDYFSSVTLLRDSVELRRMEIEVNKPLRHEGYSFYQNSYREDPARVRSIDLLTDLAPPPDAAAGKQATGESNALSEMETGPHKRTSRPFRNPVTVTVPWHQRVPLTGTPYDVEIDTFLTDFRIVDGTPSLASWEPRNPAVHLRFFEDEHFRGESWYFILHAGMAFGSGPDLTLRFTDYVPETISGLEVATHPGAGWVWAGFVVMTIGTLLTFLLRHERLWLRLQRRDQEWEIAMVHRGTARQAPEFATEDWEAAATPLMIRLARILEPSEGKPVRGPEGRSA